MFIFFLIKVLPYLIVKKSLAIKIMPELYELVKKQKEKRLRKKNNIKKTKQLRDKGKTYRQIGKKLGIDFGYARRIII
ncbi:MAG TPA: hypothetical protein PLK76_00385 [bacterium]|nr:hypothetical protein [bacterium]